MLIFFQWYRLVCNISYLLIIVAHMFVSCLGHNLIQIWLPWLAQGLGWVTHAYADFLQFLLPSRLGEGNLTGGISAPDASCHMLARAWSVAIAEVQQSQPNNTNNSQDFSCVTFANISLVKLSETNKHRMPLNE